MDYKLATVVIIKNSKDEILFLERKSPPLGDGLPGGKIEETDQSIEDACVRELYEETGIKITKKDLIFRKTALSSTKETEVHVFESKKRFENEDVKLSSEHSSFIFAHYYSNDIKLAGNTKNFFTW